MQVFELPLQLCVVFVYRFFILEIAFIQLRVWGRAEAPTSYASRSSANIPTTGWSNWPESRTFRKVPVAAMLDGWTFDGALVGPEED